MEETALADRFSALQQRFLAALRQNRESVIRLADHLPLTDLESAVQDYLHLIEKEIAKQH